MDEQAKVMEVARTAYGPNVQLRSNYNGRGPSFWIVDGNRKMRAAAASLPALREAILNQHPSKKENAVTTQVAEAPATEAAPKPRADYVWIGELSRLSGYSESYIRNCVKSGAIKNGKLVRLKDHHHLVLAVPRDEAERWLAAPKDRQPHSRVSLRSKPLKNPSSWLTPEQAAEVIGVHWTRIYHWMKHNGLPSKQAINPETKRVCSMIKRAELMTWAKENKVEVAAAGVRHKRYRLDAQQKPAERGRRGPRGHRHPVVPVDKQEEGLVHFNVRVPTALVRRIRETIERLSEPPMLVTQTSLFESAITRELDRLEGLLGARKNR